MIKNHQEALGLHLNDAGQWNRTLFSLLCTERLRSCCWAFGKKYDVDVSHVARGCDEVFRFLLTSNMTTELRLMIDRFPDTIHSSEEIGSALATQAQYGMMALANTLELCREDVVELAIDSAIHVIDVIDNFELFAWTSVPGSGNFEPATRYWLLSAELERQLDQARATSVAQTSEVVRLVVHNRQFAIPPAVL